MPRKSRKKSETGIYHVMHRGINKQIIFEDEEDNKTQGDGSSVLNQPNTGDGSYVLL